MPSRYEQLFINELHVNEFWLGDDNGGIGILLTASAEDLNLLTGASVGGVVLDVNIAGDVYSSDTVSKVLENGTDGSDAGFSGSVFLIGFLGAPGEEVLKVTGNKNTSGLRAPVIADNDAIVLASGADRASSSIWVGSIEISGGSGLIVAGNVDFSGGVFILDSPMDLSQPIRDVTQPGDPDIITPGVGGAIFTGDLVGDVLAQDGLTVILENGTGSNAWAKIDILAGDGTQILESGTDGTDAWFQGDVKAEDGADILSSGADQANSSLNIGTIVVGAGGITGDVLADDAAVIVLSGADIANSQVNAGKVTTPEIETNDDLLIDCGANKTIVLEEPVYRDINLGSAQLFLPLASFPGQATFLDEGGVNTGINTLAFDVGELIHGALEIQHDYKEGSDFVFHVHFQIIAAPTGIDNVQWQLTYTISRGGETLDSVVNLLSGDTPVDTQYQEYRSDFPAINGSISGPNGTPVQIGDQFLFSLTRVAAVGDAFAGDALLMTTGIHIEVDTLGSRSITLK